MRTTKITGCCPCCQSQAKSATDPFGDNEPRHGDYSLCAFCGEWLVLDMRSNAQNSLRKPSVKERLMIKDNPAAQRVRRSWINKVVH